MMQRPCSLFWLPVLEELLQRGTDRQHGSGPLSGLLHCEHCDQRHDTNWGVHLSRAKVPTLDCTTSSVALLHVLHRC